MSCAMLLLALELVAKLLKFCRYSHVSQYSHGCPQFICTRECIDSVDYVEHAALLHL